MTDFYGNISGPILNDFPPTKKFTKLKINKTSYELWHAKHPFITRKIIVAIGLKPESLTL